MQPTPKKLSFRDHSRDSAGMTYVYPVISRRAGGVSVGINLNPNNACNWRCVYCQVPDLKRGAAPRIDLAKLETELRQFLHLLCEGDFMQSKVPLEARRITDIAFSGNGEPTSAKEFSEVIARVVKIKEDFAALENIKLVLITNGSLIDKPHVQAGLKQMGSNHGEVWFKLDSATMSGRQRINNTRMSLKRTRENLLLAASLCPTWLQTCVFEMDGQPPDQAERHAYLDFVAGIIRDTQKQHTPLKGVLLYGLARPSMQAEAARLAPASQAWMDALAAEIRALGLVVKLDA